MHALYIIIHGGPRSIGSTKSHDQSRCSVHRGRYVEDVAEKVSDEQHVDRHDIQVDVANDEHHVKLSEVQVDVANGEHHVELSEVQVTTANDEQHEDRNDIQVDVARVEDEE